MKKRLHDNFIKLIHLLADKEYHDGNSLGEKLKISRTAVWKMIAQLKQYGILIDSVKGKGYALLEPLIVLSLDKIKKNMLHKKLDITLFACIDSTNNYLKELKHSSDIKICLAEQQTMGRGRLQREWYSPFGKNIYLSCLYPFKNDISELAGLSLVTSLAIIKTLKYYGIKDLFVKWPNDVMCQNKKISGNIIEVQAESHGTSQAVIGIGINVNMMNEHAHSISQPWISMQHVLKQYVDRNELIAQLINHLIYYLQQFSVKGFAFFRQEWLDADYLINRMIIVKNLNGKIKGQVKGITDHGFLLLELADGTMRAFSSGDTSIMKEGI